MFWLCAPSSAWTESVTAQTPPPLPECSPPPTQQVLPFRLVHQILCFALLRFAFLLSFLPSLAMVRRGTCNTGNNSNNKKQHEFNPSIIYNIMMVTVHFGDFSQKQPYSESSLPKKQTSATPTAVKSLGPVPNLVCCQILFKSFQLLLFNFSICKTGVAILPSL